LSGPAYPSVPTAGFLLGLPLILLLGACSDGTPHCSPEEVLCGSECVNFQTDPAHCGACDVVCGEGELCAEGVCVLDCPSGQMACNGECADLQTDLGNCGECGHECDPGQVCSEGSCELFCGGGLTE